MKRLILFGALCLPALLAGCIHNDLPYPVVTINIEAIEAEGLDGAAQINAAQQTVILPLLETTDIRNVHITSVTLTEGGQSSVAFPGTFDLRTPLYTTLSLYQEYGWSIAATQTIERYFRVKKQVGAAEIDPANRTATAYVSRSTDLQNVPVKELGWSMSRRTAARSSGGSASCRPTSRCASRSATHGRASHGSRPTV